MTQRRYRLSIVVMVIATVGFATLAVIDSPWWALLAASSLVWPISGAIHYGSGDH